MEKTIDKLIDKAGNTTINNIQNTHNQQNIKLNNCFVNLYCSDVKVKSATANCPPDFKQLIDISTTLLHSGIIVKE